MEKSYKQLLAALILGMLAPGLLLNVGSAGTSASSPPAQTETATQPATQPLTRAIYIPVLMEDGIVCIMELESYVLGVVLAEMPASFEMEALKAQAVVARTYGLRRLRLGDRHPSSAICTDPACCQAYISQQAYLQDRGYRQDIAKIAQAVRETEGQVLTYQGQLAEATYFSCSGGRTEDAHAVWGESIEYLQAVDSPGEEDAEHYLGSVHFTPEEFCTALNRQLEGSPESWLGEVSHTPGGGVDMQFIGGIAYPGIQLRQLLGLNSTAFTMTADGGGITVTTKGKGHRVGMSQYGADAMAVSGSGYQQILAHYYLGTKIDKMADIE